MRRFVMGFFVICALAPLAFGACQPVVHIEPASNWSSRQIEPLTHQSVLKDYLESWQSMDKAFLTDDPGLLARDFVGTARDRLAASIQEQAKAGLTAGYCDGTHNIQIVFYSPEGLSIQLTDRVDYQVSIFKKGRLLSTSHVHARYIAVLTPSATRWMVRVFQAEPQPASQESRGQQENRRSKL